MKTKIALTALALIALPAVSFAMCSDRQHQAQSCAAGSQWNADTQSCEKVVNS
ncbi:chitin-binding domain-containing protein [Lutimaribacter marinistellae]|uniref:Chitin-binding domain-containing protein n=1 Tax=Lutimaribacter marinistellae TaxID=1820329 RepID=A0ABV7TMC0_9RHOB